MTSMDRVENIVLTAVAIHFTEVRRYNPNQIARIFTFGQELIQKGKEC
jgi:hypothetical protein